MSKHFAGASRWSEDLNNQLLFYRDVLGRSERDIVASTCKADISPQHLHTDFTVTHYS
jgi:hypothetical protein